MPTEIERLFFEPASSGMAAGRQDDASASAPKLAGHSLRALTRLAAAVLLAGSLALGGGGAAAGEIDDLEDDPFAGYGYEEDEDENDPLEIPNRFIFAINQTLDVAIVRPIATLYRELLPQQVRDVVRNFLRNLRAPVVLANDLLQGETERAKITARRLVINSSAGVLGLFEVADGMGYPWHDEDFGQTLGVYGVGEGIYLVLPILGPSNVRDATGLVVDHFLDPLTYVADETGKEEWNLARKALAGVDLRARNIETLDEIERDAIDFYARIRSLYRQHRRNQIDNGALDTGLGASEGRYEVDAEQLARLDPGAVQLGGLW